MTGRGHRAVVPPADFHAHAPLAPDGLVVTVVNQAGHTKAFDFARLPVPESMQRSLAAAFAMQSRLWTSHNSAERHWDAQVLFTRFLAELDSTPGDMGAVTPAILKRWRARNIATNSGKGLMRSVRTLLQNDPQVTGGPAAEELARRIPGPKPSKQSFNEAERDRVLLTAQRQFRAALLRIRENVEVLERWQTGELAQGSRQARIGAVLDHLARTGDVPRTISPGGFKGVTNHTLLGGSGAQRTWARLFLTRAELTALAVLLTDRFAWNLSIYDRMPAPTAAPSAGQSSSVTYQVPVEKRRSGGGRWYSTENVTDSGADSPGRLITLALEATAPGRALAALLSPGTDFLMTARTSQPERESQDMDRPRPVGPLVFGISSDDAKHWARSHQLGGSPFQRTRRTTVTREGQPLQHNRGTHESVYVLPDKRVQESSRAVFEQGAHDALESARAAVFGGHLADGPDPGHQQTATADCADETSSPWPAPDGGCGADFLLCLACRNAHVHPGHHPRLAHLHRQIGSLRTALPDPAWKPRWRDHLLRLEDLKEKVGPGAWSAALTRVSESDRAMVELLLKGELAA